MLDWAAWLISVPVQRDILRFRSEDNNWEDIPDDGVLAVRVGDMRLSGYDWYWFTISDNGPIFGVDNDMRGRNVYAEICDRYPGAEIKRGIWTASDIMDKVNRELWR